MLKIIVSEKTIKPGMYDISIEDYHRGPGISRSGVMKLNRSPAHYWHEYLNPDYEPKPPTPDLVLGNALHTYVLELDQFEKRYFVIPKFNKTTKEGKEHWKKIQSELGQREILSMSQYQTVQAMAESLQKHDWARRLLNNKNVKIEQSLYWTDPDTGVLCKCRPDILRNEIICDLKTTKNGSPQSFRNDARNYGYHVQAAMIQEALLQLKQIRIESFPFLVVEKEAPYAVAIYEIEQADLDQGRKLFKDSLLSYQECLANDHWPSYTIQKISLGVQHVSKNINP